MFTRFVARVAMFSCFHRKASLCLEFSFWVFPSSVHVLFHVTHSLGQTLRACDRCSCCFCTLFLASAFGGEVGQKTFMPKDPASVAPSVCPYGRIDKDKLGKLFALANQQYEPLFVRNARHRPQPMMFC